MRKLFGFHSHNQEVCIYCLRNIHVYNIPIHSCVLIAVKINIHNIYNGSTNKCKHSCMLRWPSVFCICLYISLGFKPTLFGMCQILIIGLIGSAMIYLSCFIN